MRFAGCSGSDFGCTVIVKTLWITGAGKGIGKAVALEYAAHGWTIAISARTESDLLAVAQEAEVAGLP